MKDMTGTQSPSGASVKQRTFTRVPFSNSVRWCVAPGESGMATVRDLSRGGLCLSLGRYLRPGRVLHLHFDDVFYKSQPLEFDVRIVWCDRAAQEEDYFRAGLQVLHEEPVTLPMISELFYEAMTRLRADCAPHIDPNPTPLSTPSLAS